MKEIFILTMSTPEQQIKGKRQLNDLYDAVPFTSDKFKEYGQKRMK